MIAISVNSALTTPWATPQPLQRLCLCRIHTGHILDSTRGVTEVFGPGDVFVYAAPELPAIGEMHGTAYDVTMFDPELLNRVAVSEGTDGDVDVDED